MTRPIMTAAELAEHHTGRHGRNYALSDDGYGDLEVANRLGWHDVSAWGRDGWDLGNWPFIILFTRYVPGSPHGGYEMESVCEGDHDVYEFASEEDRNAALDYLFLWYMQSRSEHYNVFPCSREELDNGRVDVPDKFRGPFSWERLEREKRDDG